MAVPAQLAGQPFPLSELSLAVRRFAAARTFRRTRNERSAIHIRYVFVRLYGLYGLIAS